LSFFGGVIFRDLVFPKFIQRCSSPLQKIPIGPAPPAPAPQQRFNVVVPAGCVAGQLITIAGPNGKQAQVAIPAGLSAGQTFQVTMS